MKLLTFISQISTPRHQRSRCSWLVSVLLAATGEIGTEFVPVRDPDAEVAPIVPDIALATAIRKKLNITDKSQALTVANLESLTELSATHLGISNLSGLEHATNLTNLGLYWNAYSDLTPLTGLTKLTELHLRGSAVSDLTPLKNLTNLTELHLRESVVSDLTPLKDLTNLTELALDTNRISDLTPLKDLTNLESLTLHGNRISDLTPLTGLTKLDSLALNHNNIRDVSPLAGLSALEDVYLAYNHIADIDPIKPLIEGDTLYFIELRGNALLATDVAFVFTHVYDDAIGQSPEANIPNETLREALQALDGAPETLTQKFISGLTSLDLSDKDIGNFTGLEAAINLTSLTLNNTEMTNGRLSKLAGILKGLPKLRELNLGDGKISNVSSLAGLTQLTKLHLHDNTIADVAPLTDLTNLTELHLNDNRVANIEGLKTLSELQVLNLNGNHRVADVSPLSGLTSLTHLFLSRNRIADVSPLKGLTNLQELTVDRNRIGDFTPLDSLKDSLSVYETEKQKVDPVAKIPDTKLRKAVLKALGRDPDTDTAPIRVSEMVGLTALTAQNAGITDLTGLQHAVNLKTLDLSGNGLDDDDVPRLLKLTQLETLILEGNDNITNAKPFRKLKNLTTLRLPTAIATEDPVVSIPDAGLRTAILRALGKTESAETEITASDLHDLESLQASGYGISDLTGLEHAENLKELYLNDNQISNLSPISELENLRRLSLNNNNISALGSLSGLTTLRWLRLNDNRISAVAPLDSLTKLHTLEVTDNRVSNVNALTTLTGLKNLRLDSNPIDVDSLPTSLSALIEDASGLRASAFNLLDVNRDGSVNQNDIDIVSRLTGIPSGDLVAIERASKVYPDVDGDGDVDETDVATVTAAVSSSGSGS